MINNYLLLRLRFRLYFIFFVTICSTFPTLLLACNNQTLEECSGDPSCKGNRICLGRNQLGAVAPCQKETTPECFCAPPGRFVDCEKDNDCGEHEACAISGRTGRKLCVGCKAILDKKRSYTFVEKPSTKCTKERIPCGRTLDYCSENFPCISRLQCIDRIDPERAFLCSSGSTACRCEPSKGQQFFTPCTDPDTCPFRETCTYSTASNINACISCDMTKRDHFFKGFLQKCNNLTPRADPIYSRSSNGLNFDLCFDSVMCSGKRRCTQYKDSSNPLGATEPCSSINNLCFCKDEVVQSCTVSSDCPIGEVCASIPKIGLDKQCVSLAIFDSIPDGTYVIFDAKPEVDGDKVTGDECKFDWNCRSPRRCTHITQKFGGCAGRKLCTCEPLLRKHCYSDSDCDLKEKCVNYIGSKTRPFCLSTEVVSKDPNIQSPSFVPSPSTSIVTEGLTGDPCRNHTDCSGQRSCQHANEISGGCKGRQFCFCQAEYDNSCLKKSDCIDGEACTYVKDSCSVESRIFPCRATCMSKTAMISENPLIHKEVREGSSL